jgi:hypothetical protein
MTAVLPSGAQISVQIPAGMEPGMTFLASVPNSAAQTLPQMAQQPQGPGIMQPQQRLPSGYLYNDGKPTPPYEIERYCGCLTISFAGTDCTLHTVLYTLYLLYAH